MPRGLTLLASTITILLHHASVAATGVKQTDSQPRKLSEDEARSLAIYAPIPRYPREARVKYMQGSGLVLVTVDRQTGYVTSARMLESTGQQILDYEAIKAFRAWRFKPGTVSAVKIPVQFVARRRLWPQTITPEYPREARDKGLTGRGVAIVKVDPRTGYVTSAWMLKSTGHQILDDAALQAFRESRFKPKTVTTVEIPVQFTTKGVFYYCNW